MTIRYLFDADRKASLNAAGKDYTPAYIPALAAYMGISAAPIAPAELDSLTAEDILLVGAGDMPKAPVNAKAVILLGADALEFPREPIIYAYYQKEDKKLPLFAPILPTEGDFQTLAWAEADGKRLPALVKRGEKVYDFRFDLAATVWFSGDGFKIKDIWWYSFPIGRTPDFRPLPIDHDSSFPYNDMLLAELEFILRTFGVPMLHKLAPMEDGSVPDFAFHSSGDDDHTSAFYNLNAALTMEAFGIPYHINAMPAGGDFIINKDQYDEILSHGTEIALHGDFTVCPYTLESHKEQAETFRAIFKDEPVTNVNHCLTQDGSTAERMRWLAECGIIADNGHSCEIDTTDINFFNLCGFGFGTAFPRYTCDDPEHANEMIGCFLIPLTYYEPRVDGIIDRYRIPEKVINYIDYAAATGGIAQFFFHPHYLAPDNPHTPAAHAAIKLMKARVEEMGYKPHFTSTNRIAKFWKARSEAALAVSGDSITVTCEVPMILRLPAKPASVTLDGAAAPVTEKTIAGDFAWLVTIPAGTHTVVSK